MKTSFRAILLYAAPWVILAGLAAVWGYSAESLIPRLIVQAYRQESFSGLNRIIKDRSRPVEFYLQEWHQRRKGLFGATLVVAGLWAAGAANLTLWLRNRRKQFGRLSGDQLDRAIVLLVLGVAGGMFFLLTYPLLTGHVYLYDDLGYLHLPLRSYYVRTLRAGGLPGWCPDLFCGFDAHGEGQGGFVHPVKLLLYGLLPLETAFNLDTVLAYPAAFVGMWFFLRRWGMRHGPAALGGMTYAWSAYLALRLNHTNVIEILAHLPWLLGCLDVLLRSPQPKRRCWAGVAVACLTASQLLLGYPPSVWYSGAAELVYGVAVGWGRRLPGRLLAWGAAKWLGLLLAAVQVLPTWATIGLSQRAHLSRSGLAMDSLIGWNLFQWISPFAFTERCVGPARPWEFAQYAGLLAPVAVAWLLVEGGLWRNKPRRQQQEALGKPTCCETSGGSGIEVRPRERRLLLWAGLMIVGGLLFALGAYGPVFWLVATWPPFRFFRSWCRYSLWAFLGLSVAVAVAVQALTRRVSRTTGRPTPLPANQKGLSWLAHAVLGGLVVMSVGPVVLARWGGAMGLQLPWGSLLGLWVGPVGLAVLWWLMGKAVRGKPWALLGLIGFHVADLAWYDLSYWLTRCRFDRLDRFLGSIELPTEQESEGASSAGEVAGTWRGRVWTEPAQEANVFLLTNWRSAGGWWGGLVPRQTLPYPHSKALQVASVHWWKKSPFDPPPWQPVPDPLPEIRLAPQALLSQNPAQDLDKIDPAQVVLTDQPVDLLIPSPKPTPPGPSSPADGPEPSPPRIPPAPGARGTLKVLTRQPGFFRIQTNTPTRQVLVVAETWHPGWTAQVDGQPTEILRAYGDFLAVVVGPGVQEIQLAWRPASLRWGWLGTGLGMFLLVLWMGLAWICPLRPNPSDPGRKTSDLDRNPSDPGRNPSDPGQKTPDSVALPDPSTRSGRSPS